MGGWWQEQFDNAAQENQGAACEQAEISAAVATCRTVVHVTSGLRDIDNNVEANFSLQQ